MEDLNNEVGNEMNDAPVANAPVDAAPEVTEAPEAPAKKSDGKIGPVVGSIIIIILIIIGGIYYWSSILN